MNELGHGLKPSISIHVYICCVIDFPVQWYVVMEILGLLLSTPSVVLTACLIASSVDEDGE